MAFIKTVHKSATGDPRSFTVDGLPGPATISLDDAGNCKGFQVGFGKFVQVKVPAAAFGILKPEVVKAATVASELVDAAVKSGRLVSDTSKGYTAWTFKG